jgi:hypothetical protein
LLFLLRLRLRLLLLCFAHFVDNEQVIVAFKCGNVFPRIYNNRKKINFTKLSKKKMFQKKPKKVQKELLTSTRLLRCVELSLAGFLELDFGAKLHHHLYLKKRKKI